MVASLAAAPVIAGLKYLPALGAALGGIGAYRKSGGDLGATALGSGLGALSLAGAGGPIRLAGTKLAGTGLAAKVAPEAFKAGAAVKAGLAGMGPKGIAQAVKQAGMAAPIAQQMGGQQVLAQALPLALAGGASLALTPGASQMAADVAGPKQSTVGQAGQIGLGALGYRAPGAPEYGGSGVPVGLDQYGNVTPYGSLTDVYGVPGMAQRAGRLQEAYTDRDVMRTLLPEIRAAVEDRSQRELERQLAAAGVRQNIATRAAMTQRAQQAGLEAGLGALRQAGQALTSQYQYQ
tara:strand:- start:1398 stop:2273 length:876 start_codon:yes stop_codon:yes gene_type:complete